MVLCLVFESLGVHLLDPELSVMLPGSLVNAAATKFMSHARTNEPVSKSKKCIRI